ncbi:MAG TPA: phage portal protein, partial [Mycobacterium sp.]|nr:phage portal protein [Mycobacterium sp.]
MALDEEQATATVRALLKVREGEQRRLDQIAKYVAGQHDSVYVPAGANREYHWLMRVAKVNMMRLVVSVLAQNLYVDGYRRAKSDDNAEPWTIWQANRLDARQHGIHRAALKYGISYTLVLPGEPEPVITPMSPRRMTAFYSDPVNDEWPLFAVECTTEQTKSDGGKLVARKRVRLFDDAGVYRFVTDDEARTVTLEEVEEHDLGVCPVVRYLNEVDLDEDECVAGEVEPLIPLQDQANSTTFNLLMAQQFAAFRQRWVTGMATVDENGRPIQPFRARVDDVFVADDPDTKFGEFEQPLALDTPVPTPTGWTTIGDIQPGDMVIGRDGRPAAVLGMSPVLLGQTCYRVKFADGTSVVADANHKWAVKDRFRPSWGEMVCTTGEMSAEVRLGGVRPGWRWAVPQAEPLDLKPADLPVDPYLMGYWLGDGDTRRARLTVGDHDRAYVAAEIEAVGYRIVSQTQDPRTDVWALWFNTADSGPERGCTVAECGRPHKGYGLCNTHYTYAKRHGQLPDIHGRVGVQQSLRDLGVLGSKRIPANYLRASFAQRVDLLQGLMDSDGNVNRLKTAEWCTFSNTNGDLIEDVLELMRSLGLRPTRRWDCGDGKAFPSGATYRAGGIHTLGFQAPGEFCPFRMPRKADMCPVGPKSARQRYRAIVAIDEVPSVPVRCLGVDTEDHLFLVGEGFVPTHNTDLTGYLKSREETIRQMATISQTPPYYLLGVVANLSAESLAAARDGLDRKTDERKSTFGESHEQTLRLAGRAAGDDKAWEDTESQVVWRDTSTRALAQTTDALGKMAQMLGIPVQELWEKIPGVTQTDIERWKAVAAATDPLNQLNNTL